MVQFYFKIAKRSTGTFLRYHILCILYIIFYNPLCIFANSNHFKGEAKQGDPEGSPCTWVVFLTFTDYALGIVIVA